MKWRSGWAIFSAIRQDWHVPHASPSAVGCWQSNLCAKAKAMGNLPHPSFPAKSRACGMRLSANIRRSCCFTLFCPITSSKRIFIFYRFYTITYKVNTWRAKGQNILSKKHFFVALWLLVSRVLYISKLSHYQISKLAHYQIATLPSCWNI